MKWEEFEKLILRNKDGNFYPSFVIKDGEYILTEEYTAEEDYERWLKSKEVDKTNHCKTNEELSKENEQLLKNIEQLKTENSQVWETVEFLLKQVNMIPKEVIENGDTTKTINSK